MKFSAIAQVHVYKSKVCYGGLDFVHKLDLPSVRTPASCQSQSLGGKGPRLISFRAAEARTRSPRD